MADSTTVSARYFVNLYGAATLRGAAERAAQREFGLFGDFYDVPIKIKPMLARKGIQILTGGINGPGCEEARLLPVKGGFLVQLKENSTPTRTRFSLAHEVGHTLFYKNSGNIPRHQIGILTKSELDAEELICNLFASALLMPAKYLKAALPPEPDNHSSSVLDALHNLAKKFQVGLHNLTARMAHLEVPISPCVVLFSRYRENEVTGRDPNLRVDSCYPLGDCKNVYVWRNRSLRHVGLDSAENLFDAWKNRKTSETEKDWGRYSWNNSDGLIQMSGDTAVESTELVNLSVVSAGKWRSETVSMRAASYLYARKNAALEEATVVSVLLPR